MVIITEYNEQDDIPPSSSPVEEVKDKNATKAIEENKKGLQVLQSNLVCFASPVAYSADMYTAPNIGNVLDLDNYSCGQSVQEVKVANNATEAIEENKKGHLEELCGFHLHCANLLREGSCCGFLLLSPYLLQDLVFLPSMSSEAPTIGNGLDLDNYSCGQSVQEVKEANNATEVLEENKKGPLAPNIDNGLDLDNYCWGQSLQEVYVNILVPQGTKSRFIVCDIKRNHLTVGLKGQPPIVDGELYGPVKVEACFWTLEDQKSISLLLTKIDQMNWWKWVVKGEPELDTEKVEQITSLSELDPETRSSVETVMEAMGLPTLDEMQNQEMEKFIMEKYPWMDFSRAKKS
uniref:CS domain-containing protein n=1 Tax=Solanum lycopersicum TaxID=4081 RepID=A0A3Q7HNZ6_SOLLC